MCQADLCGLGCQMDGYIPLTRPFLALLRTQVFQQETSNAVMGALLLRDVADPATPSNPTLPLKNPLQLFSFGSFHGGVWRMAYTIDSIGTASVLAYLLVCLMSLLKYLLLAFVIVYAAIKAKDGENPLAAFDGAKDTVLGLIKGNDEL